MCTVYNAQRKKGVVAVKKIKQTQTLADLAYKTLKEAIVHGDLIEGEQLPEEKLAKQLGISRTPLRDALARLAVEGLIILEREKPASVAGFSENRSREFLEIRRLLEVYNIEKVISKLDESFIEQLKENLELQKDAIERNNYKDFIDLDRAFHLLLASKNNNQELREIIHRMNTGTNRAFLILSKTVPNSANDAYDEHEEIIQALEQQDVLLAKDKMTIHMNNVEKRFLTYYERQNE